MQCDIEGYSIASSICCLFLIGDFLMDTASNSTLRASCLHVSDVQVVPRAFNHCCQCGLCCCRRSVCLQPLSFLPSVHFPPTFSSTRYVTDCCTARKAVCFLSRSFTKSCTAYLLLRCGTPLLCACVYTVGGGGHVSRRAQAGSRHCMQQRFQGAKNCLPIELSNTPSAVFMTNSLLMLCYTSSTSSDRRLRANILLGQWWCRSEVLGLA